MVVFQGLLFLFFGIGLLLVVRHSLKTRTLPCGSKGFEKFEFDRDESPLGYWLMFMVYGAGGIACVIFALQLFTGHAEPLPLK